MEFYVRQSSTFIMNMLMIALALVMTFVSIELYWRHTGFEHYFFVLWMALGAVRGAVYFNYLWLSVKKLPVLIITDEYMSDEARGIKYYWADLVSMHEENLYLYIQVKEPDAYLKRIKNPVNRMLSSFYLPNFRLNLDMIKCDPDVLIELINETNQTEV